MIYQDIFRCGRIAFGVESEIEAATENVLVDHRSSPICTRKGPLMGPVSASVSVGIAQRISVGLFILFITAAAAAEWRGDIDRDIWSLPSSPGVHRWLVIHDRQGEGATRVYHVEVLERKAGEKPWQVTHRAPHMAVTEDALRRSVVKPLEKGAVYPETFDSAYAEWKRTNARNPAPVCGTSVPDCMK